MGRNLMIAVTCGLAGLLVAGCATSRQLRSPEPRARGEGAAPAGTAPVRQHGEEQARPAPTGALTLGNALSAALLGSPELAAHSLNLRAAEARLLQAGARPNPVLEFGVEEYNRAGAGLDSAELAVGLAQVFELGGKRRWRARLAEAEGELAGWDYESKRLDVLAGTARRFVEVLAAQEKLELARAAVELAERMHAVVSERVQAGKEPPLQVSRSDAALETARLEALSAQTVLDVARRKLAAVWGSETASFDKAEGRLDEVPDRAPSLKALRPRLDANPDLARWDVELRLRDAALASEKAARVPDLEASVGYLQFQDDDTDAFAVGLGMPLPLFDRNRGNIAAAEYELAKAGRERVAAQLALAAELDEAHAGLAVAHQRVITLRDRVIPVSQRAYDSAHEGYQQGKFEFMDMLDAQRGLLDARASLVDALHDHAAALIDVQRLTAAEIDNLNYAQEHGE